jgi:competence ComEA-like helix-hairpin-helix protein
MLKPVLNPILPILALSSLLIAPAQAQNDFPEGPAKEFVNRICLQCHEPSQLLSQKKTESDWKKTIARMSQKGVPGSPEQYEAITAYMTKNFGKAEDTSKINMNKATPEEIASGIGLTADEAKAVVGYRDKHGEFREWGEMLVIYGVDGRKLEAAKEKMSF